MEATSENSRLYSIAPTRLYGSFVPAGPEAAERSHCEFENSHEEVCQETAEVGEEQTHTKGG